MSAILFVSLELEEPYFRMNLHIPILIDCGVTTICIVIIALMILVSSLHSRSYYFFKSRSSSSSSLSIRLFVRSRVMDSSFRNCSPAVQTNTIALDGSLYTRTVTWVLGLG